MKNVLIALFLCTHAITYGQHLRFDQQASTPFSSRYNAHAGAKTTADKYSLCVSRTRYKYSADNIMVFDDSLAYYYLTLRGDGHIFDSACEYTYGSGRYPIKKYLRSYDDKNNLLTETDLGGLHYNYLNSYQYLCTYDASNNQTSQSEQEWDNSYNKWSDVQQFTYTYNGSNKPLTTTNKKWNKSTKIWENYYYETCTYDGSGNIIIDSFYGWNAAANSWDITYGSLYFSSYDAMNNLTTKTQVNYWAGVADTIFGYQYADFTTDGNSQLYYYLSPNPTTKTLELKSRTDSRFNSYGQVTSIMNTTYNGATFDTAYGDALYIYEYKEVTTGVQNINKKAGSVTIYPVPADDNLSIDIQWVKPQAFTLSLYDMQGKVLIRREVPSCAKYSDKVSVKNIPAGNYILHAAGIYGSVQQQVLVRK